MNFLISLLTRPVRRFIRPPRPALVHAAGTGCWTNFSMAAFPSRPEACSWYFNNSLYMFGGVATPVPVILGDLYRADLTKGPPFTVSVCGVCAVCVCV